MYRWHSRCCGCSQDLIFRPESSHAVVPTKRTPLLLSAGAEAVVESLGRVADRETRSLMTRYYTLLVKERRPRITAMREAMQAMKKERPHPYCWAPFIAIGRDAPVQPVELATTAMK